MTATILAVTGTDTGVGKTIVTAALASLASASGRRVRVMKAAQTGVVGLDESDVNVIARLARPDLVAEGARYAAPLAPAAAMRVGGEDPVPMSAVVSTISDWRGACDLILLEGAGGLLVELDQAGTTIAALAAELSAAVVLVTRAGLGTLNHTGLTLEAMARRHLRCAGVVVGSWPLSAELDCRSNLFELPRVIGADLAGVLPANIGQLPADAFADCARAGLAPRFGGDFDAADFTRRVHLGLAP